MAGSGWWRGGMAASLLVSAVGIGAVLVHDDGFACDRIRARLVELEVRSAGATQLWDDIYTLQEDTPTYLALRGEYRRAGCTPALPASTPATTVAPPPADARLLRAADVGDTYEDRVSGGTLDDPGAAGHCVVRMPTEPAPTERVDAWYVSNEALAHSATELVGYPDATSAAAAFGEIARGSHCDDEGNRQAGGPARIDVAGAEEAVSLGYTSEDGGQGLAIARVEETLVMAFVDVHFGAATADFLPSEELLARAVDRLRSSPGPVDR